MRRRRHVAGLRFRTGGTARCHCSENRSTLEIRPLTAPDRQRIVVFPFVGDRIGGSHLSALLLYEGLRESRFFPVIVVHGRGALTEHLEQRAIAFVPAPAGPLVGEATSASGYLAALAGPAVRRQRFLRDLKADIVHTNDLRMHMTWGLPARLAGARFVWHQRTVFANSGAARQLTRLADHVICISEYARSGLPARARRHASVVQNPIEPPPGSMSKDDARRMVRAELGVPPDTRVVLFLGNLQTQKRPFQFVEAAARLAKDDVGKVVFVVVGADKESMADALRQRAEALGIAHLVRLAGFRHPAQPWLAGADVLLAPQVDEGFGRTLVEAMQQRTPVIASDSGGHGEVIAHGRNGLLVRADDAEAMAAAAARVLRTPALAAELVGAGVDFVSGRFSAASHAAAVMGHYAALLSERGVLVR